MVKVINLEVKRGGKGYENVMVFNYFVVSDGR